jgi:hypothetical protein
MIISDSPFAICLLNSPLLIKQDSPQVVVIYSIRSGGGEKKKMKIEIGMDDFTKLACGKHIRQMTVEKRKFAPCFSVLMFQVP